VRPEYILLGLLMHRSMHGYDLYNQYQTQLGRVWRMSQSQMYAVLKRLEAQGLVSGLLEEDSRGPSRRLLSVTEAGSSRFSLWLLQPSDCSSRVMRLEFISRLFFASAQGKDMLDSVIREQMAAVSRELGNHERLYASLDKGQVFNRLSLDLRVRQLKASLDWLNSSVDALGAKA
jgi:PadR family transcriptional regulator, regulatory protein AphA